MAKYKIGEIYLSTEPPKEIRMKGESYNYVINQIISIDDHSPTTYKVTYYSPAMKCYLSHWDSEKSVDEGKKLLQEYESGKIT